MSPDRVLLAWIIITAVFVGFIAYNIGHRIGYLEGNRIEGNTFCNCEKAESDIAREILDILGNHQSLKCKNCHIESGDGGSVGIDAETNKFEYIPPPKEK